MRIRILSLLCLLSVVTYGQTADVSSYTGGFSMGTGPEVMDKGKWMLETGVGSEFLKETDFETDIWSLNTSVIRYGLTQTTEVFAQTGFVLSDVGGEVTSGFAPIVIGAMMRVCEEQGIVPLTTFSAWAILPVGIESIRPNEVAPAFHALFGHTLSSRWGLSYDLGLEWDGESPKPLSFVSVACSYELSSRTGLTLENYNIFRRHQSPDFNIDLGFKWKLSRKVLFSAMGTVGLNSVGDELGFLTGISWLIN